MQTRGVKKSENFADVINGSSANDGSDYGRRDVIIGARQRARLSRNKSLNGQKTIKISYPTNENEDDGSGQDVEPFEGLLLSHSHSGPRPKTHLAMQKSQACG